MQGVLKTKIHAGLRSISGSKLPNDNGNRFISSSLLQNLQACKSRCDHCTVAVEAFQCRGGHAAALKGILNMPSVFVLVP